MSDLIIRIITGKGLERSQIVLDRALLLLEGINLICLNWLGLFVIQKLVLILVNDMI